MLLASRLRAAGRPALAASVRARRPASSSSSASTKPSPWASPVTWTSLGLSGAAGAAVLAYYEYERARKRREVLTKVTTTGKPDLGGPWALVRARDGALVTNESYAGKHTLLYFGFSKCPDICPSELVKVGRVMDALPPRMRDNLVPLFVSVDPWRDSVAQLRAYAADFHPTIDFLTGTPDMVGAAGRKYRVYSSKADDAGDDDYLLDHSIVLYLVSPTGEFLDFFTQSKTASECIAVIERHMQGAGPEEDLPEHLGPVDWALGLLGLRDTGAPDEDGEFHDTKAGAAKA